MRRSGVRSSSAPPLFSAQPFSVGRFLCGIRPPRGVPGHSAGATSRSPERHHAPGSPLSRPIFSRNLRQLLRRGTRRRRCASTTCARADANGWLAGLHEQSRTANPRGQPPGQPLGGNAQHDGPHQNQRFAAFSVGAETNQGLAEIRLAFLLRLERNLLRRENRFNQRGRILQDQWRERCRYCLCMHRVCFFNGAPWLRATASLATSAVLPQWRAGGE